MNIVEQLRGIKSPPYQELEDYYDEGGAYAFKEGFQEARVEAERIAERWRRYIENIEDHLNDESIAAFKLAAGL